MKTKQLILAVMLIMLGLGANAQRYVDLGLPSGTKWGTTNQTGMYTYADMKEGIKNISSVPSEEQWQELMDICDWQWTGEGYEVTGPNGKSIFFPADGTEGIDNLGEFYSIEKNTSGYYWCSKTEQYAPGSDNFYYYYVRMYIPAIRNGVNLSGKIVNFGALTYSHKFNNRNNRYSLRLVQN